MPGYLKALTTVLAVAVTTTLAAGQSLEVVETDKTIVVSRGERVVVTYNKVSPPAPEGIEAVYERSGFMHPVVTPGGRTVTAMFPADHAHQHGIFTAWVKTVYDGRPVDFWNLARRTGRVLHERVVATQRGDDAVSFEVDLLHRAVKKPAVDVLRERWKVTVHASEATHHCFDLEVTQTALTDKPLVVKKYRYGGVALRGPMGWLSPDDGSSKALTDLKREPSGFVNDRGSDRVKGNHEHAKWVALWGMIDGNPATIAVLSHPSNFRAPQAARLHPTKPYFCFAPCVDDTFRIDRAHAYRARYRYLVTDAKPDADWLDEQWKKWAGE